jgi:hypothetical protein
MKDHADVLYCRWRPTGAELTMYSTSKLANMGSDWAPGIA